MTSWPLLSPFLWVNNQHTVHNRKTHETDVKETVKNVSSEVQSHAQPAKEEHQDTKSAKLSEMSEEKRAKLREIEVNLLMPCCSMYGWEFC